MMIKKPSYVKLLEAYERMFGTKPTIMFMTEEESKSRMKDALRTRKPIRIDVPRNALI